MSAHTHKQLLELASATGESVERVVERAVEAFRREQFFAELDAAYARLRADPVAWADELAERAELEATLADGLDDL